LNQDTAKFITTARDKGLEEAKKDLMRGSFFNYVLTKEWWKNNNLVKTWDVESTEAHFKKRESDDFQRTMNWVTTYTSGYMQQYTDDRILIKRSENTNGRRSCLENAAIYFYPNQTHDSLKATLNMISNYLVASQANTIKEDMNSYTYKHTPFIFNYCIEILEKEDPTYFDNLQNANLPWNHSLMPFKVLLERLNKKQNIYNVMRNFGFGLVKKT